KASKKHAVFCDVDFHRGDVIITDNFAMYQVDGEAVTTLDMRKRSLWRSLDVIKEDASPEDMRALLLLKTRDEGVTADNAGPDEDGIDPRQLRVEGRDDVFMHVDGI